MSKKAIKVATIGGGSGYTPELVQGFLDRYDDMPVKELWLVDVPAGEEKLAIIGAMAKRMVARAHRPLKIITTLDRRAALKDADFVTTQFRVGQLPARVNDENIPLKYGLVGQETNGAGELMMALRSIPVLLAIVKEMTELCPDAWLINFANPAGMMAEAVTHYTGWKKVIGLCNGPDNIQRDIVNALQTTREHVDTAFIGLNHLVFAKHIYLDGVDVTRHVIDLVTTEHQRVDNPGVGNWDRDFLQSLGVVPISYLQYYWKTKQVVAEEARAASHEGSRAVVAQRLEHQLFDLYRDPQLNTVPPELKKRGGSGYSQASCNLIYGLYADRRDIQTVNVPNNGACLDLAPDAVMELNCVITSHGPMPLTVGHLPVAAAGIVREMKAFEQVGCEAAVTGDYATALKALTINPLVHSDVDARPLLNELLLANEAYLPQFNFAALRANGTL
ncbi:MAG: 6-phospho-beta-glucosidase [Lactobacillus sp.]|jgi:6-phospho-beta-glucosidase|uniref:6-phospho-beta-glucosidase n=1 Tax=Lacticaseibacillus suilingensis TaxID=2799577 RepID=A0ABW4BDD1_9LACO|nr:6-phospho-beta-glucosidase [Lacticaseibacillus suilingensis]MCI1894341.1 6-phospho-beta-glucosidase [Lactobacillus sp.]MCI1917314.1 6-phospho-beta-glucosidase [Lactobacillus sp.]MCI1941097.1 6-phospho-beta-glucosidase [Lactobacillus sp.]MCI1971640.1 6-phospho-beta-glucosidase [Lactobacillus sp.]MCI2016301.1 6-phospho-beta-glucosidase [Lactobacillus sp.]